MPALMRKQGMDYSKNAACQELLAMAYPLQTSSRENQLFEDLRWHIKESYHVASLVLTSHPALRRLHRKQGKINRLLLNAQRFLVQLTCELDGPLYIQWRQSERTTHNLSLQAHLKTLPDLWKAVHFHYDQGEKANRTQGTHPLARRRNRPQHLYNRECCMLLLRLSAILSLQEQTLSSLRSEHKPSPLWPETEQCLRQLEKATTARPGEDWLLIRIFRKQAHINHSLTLALQNLTDILQAQYTTVKALRSQHTLSA